MRYWIASIFTNVPVVPAHIHGTFDALPAGKRVPKAKQVRVRFGPPIRMETYRNRADLTPKDELYRRIAHEVRATIERLASGVGE